MIQGRKIGNSPQLEFTALVDAAEAESLGLLQKQKKKRRKEMVQLIALRRPSARLQLTDYFSLYEESWIEAARSQIKASSSLRGAIILTTSILSELLDLKIDQSEHPEHWKEKYDEFCDVHRRFYEGFDDEDSKIIGSIWEMCCGTFQLYYIINSLSDWDLFEGLCSGEEDTLEEYGQENALANQLERFSELATMVHFVTTEYDLFDDEEEEKDEMSENA